MRKPQSRAGATSSSGFSNGRNFELTPKYRRGKTGVSTGEKRGTDRKETGRLGTLTLLPFWPGKPGSTAAIVRVVNQKSIN